jgi:hypothetical protein
VVRQDHDATGRQTPTDLDTDGQPAGGAVERLSGFQHEVEDDRVRLRLGQRIEERSRAVVLACHRDALRPAERVHEQVPKERFVV